MRIGPRRQPPDLAELRRLAARRRAVGDRVRRLLPGLVVGSTTLVGTGALAAWVSSQPGATAAGTSGPATSSSLPAALTPPTTDAVGALQQALQSDEDTLHSLEAAMPAVTAPTAGTPAQAAGPAAGAAGASVTVPTIAPLPKIVVPAIPQVVTSPSPVVNATTGASHAIP